MTFHQACLFVKSFDTTDARVLARYAEPSCVATSTGAIDPSWNHLRKGQVRLLREIADALEKGPKQ